MRLRNGALAESGLAWKVVVWMMSGEACGFWWWISADSRDQSLYTAHVMLGLRIKFKQDFLAA